jgi:hypothetical protein
MFNDFSPTAVRLWDNVGKYGRARQTADDDIIWHVLITCRMTKATDTHWECVILTAFPEQQWLRERALMLRYSAVLVVFCLYTPCLNKWDPHVIIWGPDSGVCVCVFSYIRQFFKIWETLEVRYQDNVIPICFTGYGVNMIYFIFYTKLSRIMLFVYLLRYMVIRLRNVPASALLCSMLMSMVNCCHNS